MVITDAGITPHVLEIAHCGGDLEVMAVSGNH